MENTSKTKAVITIVISAVMNWLGVLAVPVLLLVGSNVVDYATGILAAKYREESISSYKGIKGIVKKIGMWILVLIGAWCDILIQYSIEYGGIKFEWPFVVAIVVAIWLVVNEFISILENLQDIGVYIPPFMLPLMKNIKKKVEDKATIESVETENGSKEDLE